MQYRRSDIKGATYFFTVNLANRKIALLVDEFEKLRLAMNKVKTHHPFILDAFVVLPDHLHAIWTLPENDNDFAKRWMLIKAGFSRQLPKNEIINKSRLKKGERGIWQRRYWEHLIRDCMLIIFIIIRLNTVMLALIGVVQMLEMMDWGLVSDFVGVRASPQPT